MPRPTIVLGLGNPLMGDDGVGLAALEELRERHAFGDGVRLEDGGVLGLSLLPVVEEATALRVLDAVRFGGPPGRVVRRLALVGAEIEHATYAEPLSGPVAAAVPEMVAAALECLTAWGHPPRPHVP